MPNTWPKDAPPVLRIITKHTVYRFVDSRSLFSPAIRYVLWMVVRVLLFEDVLQCTFCCCESTKASLCGSESTLRAGVEASECVTFITMGIIIIVKHRVRWNGNGAFTVQERWMGIVVLMQNNVVKLPVGEIFQGLSMRMSVNLLWGVVISIIYFYLWVYDLVEKRFTAVQGNIEKFIEEAVNI